MKILLFIFIFFLITPLDIFAGVVINEVAWMGTENSSSDEWIELYNDGGVTVDLSGWVLKSSDDTPTINLEGSISPKGFFLLERTDDTSVPSVSADLIYVGTLSNGGEFLKLFNNSGVVEDSVDGLDGWLIGGNNSTKETLQKVSSGWTTKQGTPKAPNEIPQEIVSGSATKESEYVAPTTGPSLTYIQEGTITAIINNVESTYSSGAEREFLGRALGLKDEPLSGARYVWNFGDGVTIEGQNVYHTYNYEGDYIVILTVSSGKYFATDRMDIKIVKSDIIISGVGSGTNSFVELHNKSEYEINLSGWILRSGNRYFIIPKNTFMRRGGKLIFASPITNFIDASSLVTSLHYPNNVTHNIYSGKTGYSDNVIDIGTPVVVNKNINKSEVYDSIDKDESRIDEINLTASVIDAGIYNDKSEKSSSILWVTLLFALIFISVFGVLLSRKNSNITDEFTIINDVERDE